LQATERRAVPRWRLLTCPKRCCVRVEVAADAISASTKASRAQMEGEGRPQANQGLICGEESRVGSILILAGSHSSVSSGILQDTPLAEPDKLPAGSVEDCNYHLHRCPSYMEIAGLFAFTDNYIRLLRKQAGTVVVDPGGVGPVLRALCERGGSLAGIGSRIVIRTTSAVSRKSWARSGHLRAADAPQYRRP
jgi:hypothetical protein